MRLDNYEIPGHALQVTVVCSIQTKDQSGFNSSTLSAFEGVKPKRLEVGLKIKFDQAQDLNRLIQKYEATEGKNQTIYQVTDPAAQAVGLRKARFDGQLRVHQDPSLRLWNVSFVLVEVQSIAEIKEKRAEPKEPEQQNQNQNQPTQTGEKKNDEESSVLEKILRTIDDSLA